MTPDQIAKDFLNECKSSKNTKHAWHNSKHTKHLCPPLKYMGRPSCERFFTYTKQGDLDEWMIPNTGILRSYWKPHLHPLVIQKLLFTLPGEKHFCLSCAFQLPVQEMHNDTQCCACVDNGTTIPQKLDKIIRVLEKKWTSSTNCSKMGMKKHSRSCTRFM